MRPVGNFDGIIRIALVFFVKQGLVAGSRIGMSSPARLGSRPPTSKEGAIQSLRRRTNLVRAEMVTTQKAP